MALAETINYPELLTELDAAIAALTIVDGADPHSHLGPALLKLKQLRRRYRHLGAGVNPRRIRVTAGTRARLGLDE